jgi:predicted amidohydrolase
MRLKAPAPVLSRPVRVCCIQYALRPVPSFKAFAEQVENFVDVADDYDADLILFPELISAQLLSSLPRGGAKDHARAMRDVSEKYTGDYDALFTHLSRTYNRIIAGGTHPRWKDGQFLNMASVFVPGYEPIHQPKLHLTPTERQEWAFDAGHELALVETYFGCFGISICYDVQFPEIARLQSEQGMQLLLVPYLTDNQRGHSRVTSCAKARAIENQIYAATAGMAGGLPMVTDLTTHFAHSGVAAEATSNSEMVVVADLDLALLDRNRTTGSVHSHQDAAEDGLHVTFDGQVTRYERPWMEP